MSKITNNNSISLEVQLKEFDSMLDINLEKLDEGVGENIIAVFSKIKTNIITNRWGYLFSFATLNLVIAAILIGLANKTNDEKIKQMTTDAVSKMGQAREEAREGVESMYDMITKNRSALTDAAKKWKDNPGSVMTIGDMKVVSPPTGGLSKAQQLMMMMKRIKSSK